MVSGVVEWVNSFGSADGGPPPPPVAAEEDLWDGSTLARVAACITGDGDGALMSLVSASSQVGNNWVLAQGNVKKLLRVLERFYQSELGKRADFAGVDCAKMTRDRDRTEILKVVELLVGAAVQCDDKAQHIGAIMKLSMDSQADLQQMIQSALAKTTDLAPGSARKSSVHSIADAGVSALVAAEAELAKAHAEISRLEEENEVLLSRAAAAEAAEGGASASARDVERAEEMKLALAEAQVLLEDRAQDIAELRQMLEAAESKVAQESRQRARFEADIRLIRDELDLAQDKAGRLAKAESSVERYKKRIEELSGLKERLAEAEEQSAQYLDQVLNLESETKAIPTLKKKIEQYKDEKVELERKLYQAESSVSLKADEVARLKQELDIALQQKTFFEDEMISMREARGIGRAEEDEDEDGREASAPGLFESSAAQREQLVRLRRENELLKVKVGSSGGSDSEEVALLQNQLEDALRVKEERMADAMAAKRTAAEMEMQMHKLREHVKALEGSKSASQQMKDDSRMADLLAQVESLSLQAETAKGLELVVQQMTDQLKERESAINEKDAKIDKLESYTKRTLQKFSKQYMEKLQSMSTVVKERNEKIEYLENKLKMDRENHKREDRLLSSALYELGMDIMETKLMGKVADRSSDQDHKGVSGSWLQQQRQKEALS